MNDWLNKYGPVALGIAIGTAAKYGLVVSEGGLPALRAVLADMLLLGMVSILSLVVTDQLGLHGNQAVLCAALFSISSDRAVRIVRDKFLKKAEDL